jgi:hypothetical protein
MARSIGQTRSSSSSTNTGGDDSRSFARSSVGASARFLARHFRSRTAKTDMVATRAPLSSRDHSSGLPPDIRRSTLGRCASSALPKLCTRRVRPQQRHPRHFRSRSAEPDMVATRAPLSSRLRRVLSVYTGTRVSVYAQTNARAGVRRDDERLAASGSPQSTPSRRRMCDCREISGEALKISCRSCGRGR